MGGIVSTLPEEYASLSESAQQELTAKFQVLLNDGKSQSEAIECLRLEVTSSSASSEGGGGGGVDEYIPLTSLVKCIEQAVAKGKTPLIIDRSADNKVDTFFAYQSVIVINGKKMGLDKSLRKVPVGDIMEGARAQLVAGLGYGYPIIVTLGNGVCDFATTFADEVYSDRSDELDLKSGEQAFFPRMVFEGAGRGLLQDAVMNRLFREAEKTSGVAFCRHPDTFYVAVTTHFSPEDFEEYLFGNEWGLPNPREMYHCIAIQYEADVDLLT